MKVDQNKIYVTGGESQYNTNLNLKREFDINSELGLITMTLSVLKRI